MLSPHAKRVIGVGSPIVDLLAEIPEAHLTVVGGEKGGMELVDHAAMLGHIEKLPSQTRTAPGGSAANTIFAMAQFDHPAAFLGKLGEDDHATLYHHEFARRGGDTSRFKRNPGAPTAVCLSLITPDSQRTMRTFLGAAATLDPHEVSVDDFRGHGHAHIEGYLAFNRDLLVAVLEAAHQAGCTISLSLGSFEVVHAAKDILPDLLTRYVDMVFANEDEAEAFCGDADPERGLEALGAHCETVAITLGSDGAWVRHGGQVHRAESVRAEQVVDTTGAGDLWAAGFLLGRLNGHSLEVAARFGAILGSLGVQRVGASLDNDAAAAARALLAQALDDFAATAAG
ncbi:MAG: adenosine kinase [Candidatus Hydrogenedens sp.]|nr:adenosine kinase [Candidatus Hydrogenedens sp.]